MPIASGTPCSTQPFQLRILKNSLKTRGKGTFGQCGRQCDEFKRGSNLIGSGYPSMARSVERLKQPSSNPAGGHVYVSCECCFLSNGVLFDGLITRPEESYLMWCVLV